MDQFSHFASFKKVQCHFDCMVYLVAHLSVKSVKRDKYIYFVVEYCANPRIYMLYHRKRKSKHKSNVKRFRIDPPSDLLPNLPQCNPMLTSNRTDDSAQRVTDQNSGTHNTSDGTKPDLTQPNKEHRPVNKQTSSNKSDQTTSQPIKCLINNETLDSRIVPCANEMKHTESPIDDRIKLDDLENSEIIILDSFDNRESDSDNKVCI